MYAHQQHDLFLPSNTSRLLQGGGGAAALLQGARTFALPAPSATPPANRAGMRRGGDGEESASGVQAMQSPVQPGAGVEASENPPQVHSGFSDAAHTTTKESPERAQDSAPSTSDPVPSLSVSAPPFGVPATTGAAEPGVHGTRLAASDDASAAKQVDSATSKDSAAGHLQEQQKASPQEAEASQEEAAGPEQPAGKQAPSPVAPWSRDMEPLPASLSPTEGPQVAAEEVLQTTTTPAARPLVGITEGGPAASPSHPKEPAETPPGDRPAPLAINQEPQEASQGMASPSTPVAAAQVQESPTADLSTPLRRSRLTSHDRSESGDMSRASLRSAGASPLG